MDKIWDRNPSKSEVIGRCGGDEKPAWSRRTDNSRTLIRQQQQQKTVVSIYKKKYLVDNNYRDTDTDHGRKSPEHSCPSLHDGFQWSNNT